MSYYDNAEPANDVEQREDRVRELQETVKARQQVLTHASSAASQASRELLNAKRKLAKAQRDAQEPERLLTQRLRQFDHGTVLRFTTTDTGHTYVAFRANVAWYLTQNGKGSQAMPPVRSAMLAKLIGKANVERVTGWEKVTTTATEDPWS